MTRTMKSLTTLVLLLSALTARAQFEFPLTQPKFVLMTNPLVKEHLKVSSEQTSKIDKVLEDIVQRDGDKVMVVLRGDMDMTDLDKDVLAVLDEKQRVRFAQLWRQQNGLVALSEEKTAAEFSVTDEQKKKLSKIFEEYRTELTDFFMNQHSNGNEEVSVDRKKMEEMKKGVEAKIRVELTEEQQKKWKESLGEAFEFEKKKDGGVQ
ncbi:MAG: hypothetical protein JST30_07480 [Armatimonadetes bacterium]|nr:hypothetical protein [Armatimonadota bacterium]